MSLQYARTDHTKKSSVMACNLPKQRQPMVGLKLSGSIRRTLLARPCVLAWTCLRAPLESVVSPWHPQMWLALQRQRSAAQQMPRGERRVGQRLALSHAWSDQQVRRSGPRPRGHRSVLGPDRPRSAQISPDRPRSAQISPDRARSIQISPDRPR